MQQQLFEEQQPQRRLELQGLRALAISAVLLYHFFPEVCPNGFVGVDIFFVLSGYLISKILRGELEENEGMLSSEMLVSFYYRRLKRILPLHWLFCLGAALLIALNSDPFRITMEREDALFAIPFLTNIRALFDRFDYFKSVKTDSLFTHIWSLSVEVQFYLIAPLLYSLLPKKSRLLSVMLLSFVAFVLVPSPFAFNSMPLRLWQFLAGAVHLFDQRRDDDDIQQQAQVVSLLGEVADDFEDPPADISRRPSLIVNSTLEGRLVAYFLFVAFFPLNLDATIARVLVTLASTAFIHCDSGELRSLLRRSLFVFLGDISYALYLIHWPIVTFSVDAFHRIYWPTRLIGIPLSIAITIFVHEVFEKHYRTWTKPQIGCSCLLLLSLTTATLLAARPINDYLFPLTPDIADAVEKNMAFFADPQANLMIPECTYWPFRGAKNSSSFWPPHGACDMPPGNGKLRFAVIGNSYAADHARMIWLAFKPFFSAFQLFSEGGCEVLAQTPPEGCEMWFNYTEAIDDLRPDVTFIVQRYNRPRYAPIPPGNAPDSVYDEMLEHFQWLKNKSAFFYIAEPMPSTELLEMRRLIHMMRQHMSPRAINKRVMQPRDEVVNAKPRTDRLAKECGNCVVYEVVRFLANSLGRVELFEGDTSLALMEPYAHLTPRGRERVLPAYEELARNETSRLRELEKRLYPAQ